MNVFYLDEDPRQCAEWMVDRHVVKMIVETAQLLSTAHRLLDGVQVEVTYKTPDKVMPLPFEDRTIIKPGKVKKKNVWILPDDRNDVVYACTHRNHPSAIWARESVENYNWLADHLYWLGQEYTYRYGKKHATIEKCFYTLQSPPHGLRTWDWTKPPSAMADEYIISEDPVANYRNYYKYGKAKLHKWKNREIPEWIK